MQKSKMAVWGGLTNSCWRLAYSRHSVSAPQGQHYHHHVSAPSQGSQAACPGGSDRPSPPGLGPSRYRRHQSRHQERGEGRGWAPDPPAQPWGGASPAGRGLGTGSVWGPHLCPSITLGRTWAVCLGSGLGGIPAC